MPVGIVVFDLDGTIIISKNSWRRVHEFFGSEQEADAALSSYEMGKIDYAQFMQHDLGLWPKGISIRVFERILGDYELAPGAEDVVAELKSRGIKTAIISSGIDILANRVSNRLGIDVCIANGLEFDERGRFIGKGIMRVDPRKKDEVLLDLLKPLRIAPAEAMGVGDSRFDLKMFEACAYRIAFKPGPEDRELVEETVHYVIDDLRDLIGIIEIINEQASEKRKEDNTRTQKKEWNS